MDTSSFIDGLHRFIARRGCPKTIRSDNGGNFIGAERELREEVSRWSQHRINKVMAEARIEWKFNPPLASHMGGAWERQIRSIRRVFAGLTQEQVLTDEGLSTLMCMTEAIINSRPLTPVSDDPRDPEALTPNHLLLLRQVKMPPGIYNKEDAHTKKRWRQVQYLADIFWKRWLREYLPQLRQRTKWLLQERDLAINDLVLLIDYQRPRNDWSLGRIVDVYRSTDNHVRTARIRTKGGEVV